MPDQKSHLEKETQGPYDVSVEDQVVGQALLHGSCIAQLPPRLVVVGYARVNKCLQFSTPVGMVSLYYYSIIAL